MPDFEHVKESSLQSALKQDWVECVEGIHKLVSFVRSSSKETLDDLVVQSAEVKNFDEHKICVLRALGLIQRNPEVSCMLVSSKRPPRSPTTILGRPTRTCGSVSHSC